MDTIVIDSSIMVKWLNQKNEDDIDKADKILDDTRKGDVELIAPELAKYEVCNVLLKGKLLSSKEANLLIETLFSLPITFIAETEDLAGHTYSIAFDHGITYYDAAFISLAKQYGAALITENIKHQGKAKDVKVIALKDY